MLETRAFGGQSFSLYRRTDKACDTVGDSPRHTMGDVTYLERIRCESKSHSAQMEPFICAMAHPIQQTIFVLDL
jgi:hypothetical protein